MIHASNCRRRMIHAGVSCSNNTASAAGCAETHSCAEMCTHTTQPQRHTLPPIPRNQPTPSTAAAQGMPSSQQNPYHTKKAQGMNGKPRHKNYHLLALLREKCSIWVQQSISTCAPPKINDTKACATQQRPPNLASTGQSTFTGKRALASAALVYHALAEARNGCMSTDGAHIVKLWPSNCHHTSTPSLR